MTAFDTQAPASLPGLYASGPEVYFKLLKPRVMSLSVMTAFAGMIVAPGHLHPALAAIALVAIAAGAGGAGALNMWWDSDIDGRMARTRLRPIPSGQVAPGEALALGLLLSFFSVVVLDLATNALAAGLLAFTIFFYLVIYSMWLKRLTPQNIVIGGAAGALPPMVGYAAISGSVTLDSLLLFAIIFVWTPPHFWALALVKQNDYARVDMPMMPNVKGVRRTKLEILLYSARARAVGRGAVLHRAWRRRLWRGGGGGRPDLPVLCLARFSLRRRRRGQPHRHGDVQIFDSVSVRPVCDADRRARRRSRPSRDLIGR